MEHPHISTKDLTSQHAPRSFLARVRLRERLGIRPGTVLEFHEEADRLVAEKAETTGALDRWYGRLGQKRRTDDIIQVLRGEP